MQRCAAADGHDEQCSLLFEQERRLGDGGKGPDEGLAEIRWSRWSEAGLHGRGLAVRQELSAAGQRGQLGHAVPVGRCVQTKRRCRRPAAVRCLAARDDTHSRARCRSPEPTRSRWRAGVACSKREPFAEVPRCTGWKTVLGHRAWRAQGSSEFELGSRARCALEIARDRSAGLCALGSPGERQLDRGAVRLGKVRMAALGTRRQQCA